MTDVKLAVADGVASLAGFAAGFCSTGGLRRSDAQLQQNFAARGLSAWHFGQRR